MFQTGAVELMSVNDGARSRGMIGISLIFFNMKVHVYCAFSVESPNEAILMSIHTI